MASSLLPSNNERKQLHSKDRKILGAADLKYGSDLEVDMGKAHYTAKDRRPVQVDPPVLKMIRDISYAKDMTMYDVVRDAMDAYLGTMTPQERVNYDSRQNG